MSAKLYLLCGLPGSGKSTFAKRLKDKTGAVILSHDEILLNKFGRDFPSKEFKSKQETVLKLIENEAEKNIKIGNSVILDIGFWKRADRKKYIDKAKVWGAGSIIYFFNINKQVLLNRLKDRSSNKKNDSLIVTEEMLRKFIKEFELPEESEAKILEIN